MIGVLHCFALEGLLIGQQKSDVVALIALLQWIYRNPAHVTESNLDEKLDFR